MIGVAAALEDGSVAWAPAAEIDVVEPDPPPEPWQRANADGPSVAICMATFNPPQGLLERQIDSVREQRHGNWVCCISDDHSAPERFAALERLVAGDERFRVSRAARHLGHYENFERALRMAPSDCDFVALCDQDDRWHPDKLEVLLTAIGDAQLVYSDARLVDEGGRVISETYWSRRRNNHTNLTSLLIANTVTGAASLARRDLLDHALPFPPRLGHPYHDHWLAVAALTRGRIEYVDRPLYDYVQHGGAQIGHAGANAGAPRGLRSLRGARSASDLEPAADVRELARHLLLRRLPHSPLRGRGRAPLRPPELAAQAPRAAPGDRLGLVQAGPGSLERAAHSRALRPQRDARLGGGGGSRPPLAPLGRGDLGAPAPAPAGARRVAAAKPRGVHGPRGRLEPTRQRAGREDPAARAARERRGTRPREPAPADDRPARTSSAATRPSSTSPVASPSGAVACAWSRWIQPLRCQGAGARRWSPTPACATSSSGSSSSSAGRVRRLR